MYRISHFTFHLSSAFCGITLVVYAIETMLDLRAGTAVFAVIPLLIAAMLEGQHVARVTAKSPTPGQCWETAFGMGGIVAAILAFAYGVQEVFLTHLGLTFWFSGSAVDWVGFALCAAAVVAVLRIGFALGVATEVRSEKLRKS